MTNTLRATTALSGSADSFALARSSETATSSVASTPSLSSASKSIRQGSAQTLNSFERFGPHRVDRHEVLQESIRTKSHVVILDSDLEHATTLADRLRRRQLTLTTHRKLEDALQVLCREHPGWDMLRMHRSRGLLSSGACKRPALTTVRHKRRCSFVPQESRGTLNSNFRLSV
jgi:hypothetical protein